MLTIGINLLTVLLFILSFIKDKEKTKKALSKMINKFFGLLPVMIIMIALIGVMLSFFSPELIKKYLGQDMGLIQLSILGISGSIAMIPSLIALPLAGSLVDSGASYTSISMFITTLTMVGFVTIPLELKELGKKITILRNTFAFVFAVIISLIIGGIM